MNPEEGELRPQLLDRFGLVAHVESEADRNRRAEILHRVLDFERALANHDSEQIITSAIEKDQETKERLRAARQALNTIQIPPELAEAIIDIAQNCQAVGHRGERVLALSACAFAAIDKESLVQPNHIRQVAKMALQHRVQHRKKEQRKWGDADDKYVLDRLANLS